MRVVVSLTFGFAPYLAGAFIALEPNVAAWTQDGRFFAVALGFVCAGLCYVCPIWDTRP